MKIFLFICVIIGSFQTLGQSLEDMAVLQSHFSKPEKEKVYANNKEQKFYIKYNPVYHVFKTSLRLYKINISPQLATTCIYAQSCSHFSNHAIETYGLLKGFFLTCDRISRCNRLSYSDVPFYKKDLFGKVKDPMESYQF